MGNCKIELNVWNNIFYIFKCFYLCFRDRKNWEKFEYFFFFFFNGINILVLLFFVVCNFSLYNIFRD